MNEYAITSETNDQVAQYSQFFSNNSQGNLTHSEGDSLDTSIMSQRCSSREARGNESQSQISHDGSLVERQESIYLSMGERFMLLPRSLKPLSKYTLQQLRTLLHICGYTTQSDERMELLSLAATIMSKNLLLNTNTMTCSEYCTFSPALDDKIPFLYSYGGKLFAFGYAQYKIDAESMQESFISMLDCSTGQRQFLPCDRSQHTDTQLMLLRNASKKTCVIYNNSIWVYCQVEGIQSEYCIGQIFKVDLQTFSIEHLSQVNKVFEFKSSLLVQHKCVWLFYPPTTYKECRTYRLQARQWTVVNFDPSTPAFDIHHMWSCWNRLFCLVTKSDTSNQAIILCETIETSPTTLSMQQLREFAQNPIIPSLIYSGFFLLSDQLLVVGPLNRTHSASTRDSYADDSDSSMTVALLDTQQLIWTEVEITSGGLSDKVTPLPLHLNAQVLYYQGSVILYGGLKGDRTLNNRLFLLQPVRSTHFESLLGTMLPQKDMQGYADFFDQPALSDIKVQVEDKQYCAHRLVLAAHSRVFNKMLQHECTETQTNVIKMGTDVASVDILLRYMYGMLQIDDQFLNANVLDIFAVAHRYQVQGLMTLCTQVMQDQVRKKNMLQFFKYAEQYQIDNLKHKIIEEGRRHGWLKELVPTDDFLCLMQEHPKIAQNLLVQLSHQHDFDPKF